MRKFNYLVFALVLTLFNSFAYSPHSKCEENTIFDEPTCGIVADFDWFLPLDCSVQFNDLTNRLPDAIPTWSWDFNDPASGTNNFSTLENPIHNFTSPGTYNVTLLATGTNNNVTCTSTVSHQVIILSNCIDSCVLAHIFLNYVVNSFIPVDPILDCGLYHYSTSTPHNLYHLAFVDWGDGNPIENILTGVDGDDHQFPSNPAMMYTVHFWVETPGGTLCAEEFVTVDISCEQHPCLGATDFIYYADGRCGIDFIDLSSINSGTAVGWIWDFGQPSSGALNQSTLQNPHHAYGNQGLFTICLTTLYQIDGIGGCSDVNCQDIFLFECVDSCQNAVENVAQIHSSLTQVDPINDCGTYSVELTNLILPFQSVLIDWGDGVQEEISTGVHFHTYLSNGLESITVTVLLGTTGEICAQETKAVLVDCPSLSDCPNTEIGRQDFSNVFSACVKPCRNTGSCFVRNSFEHCTSRWASNIFDHTSGDGSSLFLAANSGDVNSDGNIIDFVIAGIHDVNIEPGIEYNFSFWFLANISNFHINPPKFDIVVSDNSGNSEIVAPINTAGSANNVWTKFELLITSSIDGQHIELNQTGGFDPNNSHSLQSVFGLDDFVLSQPELCVTAEKETYLGNSNISSNTMYAARNFNWTITLENSSNQPSTIYFDDLMPIQSLSGLSCPIQFLNVQMVPDNQSLIYDGLTGEGEVTITEPSTQLHFRVRACTNTLADGHIFENCFSFGENQNEPYTNMACDSVTLIIGCPGGFLNLNCVIPGKNIEAAYNFHQSLQNVQTIQGSFLYDPHFMTPDPNIASALILQPAYIALGTSIVPGSVTEVVSGGMMLVSYEISAQAPFNIGNGNLFTVNMYIDPVADGCTDLLPVSFIVNGNETIFTDPGQICTGLEVDIEVEGDGTCANTILTAYVTPVILSPNNTRYTYLWSNGSISDHIVPANSGTYSVTVTENAGCDAEASVAFACILCEPPSDFAFEDNYLVWQGNASLNTLEFVSDYTCCPQDVPRFDPQTFVYTTSDTRIDLNTVLQDLQQKCFKWRIKSECSDWSDWCCLTTYVSGAPFGDPFGDCIDVDCSLFKNTVQVNLDVSIDGCILEVDNNVQTGIFNVEYSWDFGDGLSSTEPAPTHIYESNGTYLVTVTISDIYTPCEITETYSFQVQICDEIPTCPFEINWIMDLTLGCRIRGGPFRNNLPTGATVLSYNWNFGDGTESNTMNLDHTYDAAGTYNICLTMIIHTEDKGICQAQLCKEIVITNCIGGGRLGESSDIKAQNELSIYPNPTSDMAHIHVKEGVFINSIEMKSLGGCTTPIVIEGELNESVEINVSEMTNGVYILKVITNNGIETGKLIIQ